MRVRLVACVAAALALLCGCTEVGTQAPSEPEQQAVTEWHHPTSEPVVFSGPTSDGSTFSSKQHAGEVLVVNFWFASCGPCRAEASVLKRSAERFAHAGVQFVGIDVSDDAATAASFERSFETPYPSIIDQAQSAAAQLAFASNRPPRAVPSTLVLDRNGRVTARIVGGVNESILGTLIQEAATDSR